MNLARTGARVCQHGVSFAMEYPGGRRQVDVHLLWPVLYEPAAVRSALLVLLQECEQAGMADALALQSPLSASVKRQPLVAGGYLRPVAGEGCSGHGSGRSVQVSRCR